MKPLIDLSLELARWHIKSPACKHLLLGISHDAGYAPFLDEIFTKGQDGDRVSLIEGFPTHKDIARTGVNVINMTSSVFRAEKLIDRQTGLVNDSTPSTIFNDFVTTTPTAGASPPRQIKLLIPAKAAPKKASNPAWVPGPRGLDPPVSCTQAGMDTVKKRAADKKPCNVFYLRDACPRGISDCPFDHRQKMSKDEKNAIAFLSRTNPCQNGQDCTNEDCIYGHNVSYCWMLHERKVDCLLTRSVVAVPYCQGQLLHQPVLQVYCCAAPTGLCFPQQACSGQLSCGLLPNMNYYGFIGSSRGWSVDDVTALAHFETMLITYSSIALLMLWWCGVRWCT